MLPSLLESGINDSFLFLFIYLSIYLFIYLFIYLSVTLVTKEPSHATCGI